MADRVGQQPGNCQLLCLLGRDAFAEMYLGEHQYLEIPAAIKVLHVQMEPEMQESFRREARTIAHLQHPHIVRLGGRTHHDDGASPDCTETSDDIRAGPCRTIFNSASSSQKLK